MTLESKIDSPAAAGALIRHQRINHGLTQQALADAAGVSRKFLIDLESGHERAELDKTMSVLTALGLTLTTATPIPRGSDHDPQRRDYAATFTNLIAKEDFEFAIKMLADYASASLKTGKPLLQRNPELKDEQWSSALAGITNYTARRLGQLDVSHARVTGDALEPGNRGYTAAGSLRSTSTRSSSATWATGLPVSITNRAALALCSGENFRRAAFI